MAAFSVSLLIIAVLVAERFAFERDILAAGEGARSATRLNGDILLADERLTMSANMAAATGEERWIARYEQYIPSIDAAIAEAKELAAPEVSREFDAATRAANDLLVEMERRSFELVRGGRSREARAVLDGPDYSRQKEILAAGSDRFAGELLDSQQRNLEWVRTRSVWIVASLIALALAGFVFLWRYLNRMLSSSRGVFLDAERQVHRLALHDPLTGLPNRRYLQQELQRLMREGAERRTSTAVIMLDLDRFKPINDRLAMRRATPSSSRSAGRCVKCFRPATSARASAATNLPLPCPSPAMPKKCVTRQSASSRDCRSLSRSTVPPMLSVRLRGSRSRPTTRPKSAN